MDGGGAAGAAFGPGASGTGPNAPTPGPAAPTADDHLIVTDQPDNDDDIVIDLDGGNVVLPRRPARPDDYAPDEYPPPSTETPD